MTKLNLPRGSHFSFSLEGQTAIVTGAARGIGYSIARGFAEAGAKTFINDINPKAAEEAVKSLRDLGLDASALPFDVTDHDAASNAVDQIAAQYGQVDILMNNAGILIRKPIETHDMADWDRVLSINLSSFYNLARSASVHMKKKNFGRIINTASLMGISSRPGVVSYVAAKHGVVGLTRALAAELGPFGITVNAIGPGYVATEINKATMADQHFNKLVIDRTPLGRWSSPDELAGPAVFLASKAANFVTGHVLMVDGGMSSTVFLVPSDDLGLAAST